jgi:beta-N-acetylhexosaminidase
MKLSKYWSTITLLIVLLVLIALNITLIHSFQVSNPDKLLYNPETNVLDFSKLTMEQKIAQMLIVYGKEENSQQFQNMLTGGIFLDALPTEQDFIDRIETFQSNAVIPFFVTTDLEGCRNPFENFKQFPTFKEINSVEEAYQLGIDHGKILARLGFTMNFAPVIDLEDTIWNCRSFIGSPEEIAEKGKKYIQGIQEQGILAVAKHYPGKTLTVGDSHKIIVSASINKEDLIPFEMAIESEVNGLMMSHLIVDGFVNSKNKPAGLSPEIVQNARQSFEGLILTDEIGMQALSKYYFNESLKKTEFGKMFIEIFQGGADLILTFDKNPERIYTEMIQTVAKAVELGQIDSNKIDRSVLKILKIKGISVINFPERS